MSFLGGFIRSFDDKKRMYLLKKPADELDDPDVVYPRSDEMIEKNKINQ